MTSLALPYEIGCGLAGGNWVDHLACTREEQAASRPSVRVVIFKLPDARTRRERSRRGGDRATRRAEARSKMISSRPTMQVAKAHMPYVDMQ
mmetsp:Transcript_27564/g.51425  ORF Transcript_27564/g.51425 Transcript_27564/m.51425 type:complete len:92 (+) Transcript_27564:758-1033(+)